MSTIEVIKNLMATNSRNDKEAILEQAWKSGERNFFIGAKLAYDTLVTFGVAKVAEIVEDDGSSGSLTFSDFLTLAEKLRKRELTGNAAKDAINASAMRCNAEVWNLFYRRILIKDLRAGLEEKTINKVLAKIAKTDKLALDFLVPVFSCQLAKSADDHPKKVQGKVFVDCKLDGVRLLTILDKETNSVVQYTRNGKVNTNFTNITESLQPLLQEIPVSIVLDGEVVSRNFQELMKQVNRKENVNTSDAKLALFDIIPLDDFRNGVCKVTQKDRHNMLVQLTPVFQKYTGKTVYVIPKMTIDLDTDEGKKTFRQFNIDTLDAGYEGIMIKNMDATYQTKRSDAWLKQKPFITVDLEVVGFEEGDKQFVGSLGAVVCEGEDDGKKIKVNVGGGWSVQQRAEIWASYTGKPVSYVEIDKKSKEPITIVVQPGTNILGQIVEVKADCLTRSTTLKFNKYVAALQLDNEKSKEMQDLLTQVEQLNLEYDLDNSEDTLDKVNEISLEITNRRQKIYNAAVESFDGDVYEEFWSLRFPRFERFRSLTGDKGDKI